MKKAVRSASNAKTKDRANDFCAEKFSFISRALRVNVPRARALARKKYLYIINI